MSPPNTPSVHDDDDLQALAGRYVLGLLSAHERAEVQEGLDHDEALRQAVDAWQERLQPLNMLVDPVDPLPSTWARIERSLDPATPSAAAVPTGSRGDAFARWWQSLALWRGLAGAAGLAAVVLASLLVLQSQQPAQAPAFMVVLVAPQDRSPGWVVQASARVGEVQLIPLGQTAVPAGKSLQFWTKADGWKGPVSLGLVEPGHAIRVPLKSLPPLQAQQLFELTLEPPQGSPLDRPTGPVQFIGRAVPVS
ncbi:RNA polymerase subunit sigma-70 [Xylophilus rhododendri]|uniref:RNA polymerase subunit sigma-70 n=1 Tax=Xylophilus rhododendri TaxID=2697032 RepID=A0A857J352_9BURK|nr:anti-sigma factor [Xylophilus rhododendri]QHI97683.1 RNA polymerase subunit sigma-70 [Xylophilus rhododendri]